MSSAGEAASTVATRARGASNYAAGYALEHPLYVAMAVGALTWWMLRGRSRSDSDWYGAADTNWDDSEALTYGEDRSLRDRAGEYVSSARDTVGEYASTARQTVGEYASTARDTVGEYATSARDSARLAAMRARGAASSAAGNVNDWVTDNPMAAGAIALAIGAVIGAAVPRTEFEDGTMGETRDRAWEKASRIANNLKENVTQKVSTAAENLVTDSVKSAATTPPAPEGRV